MLKSRSGQPVNASGTAVPSIELVRRRARHRLIGASVLVLAGVVGFSLLFDAQPRPIAVDIPIEIPSRGAPAVTPPAASAPATPARSQEVAADREEPAPDPAPATATAPAQTPVPPPDPAPVPPPAPSPAPAPAATDVPARPSPAPAPPATSSDGARAQALLEGRSPATPAAAARPAEATVRLVVQVGAFADNARAQEVRMRLERAGLKTYTQVAETPEGRRIRVRVGPFDSQQEADRAAERVRALNLPARVLTL